VQPAFPAQHFDDAPDYWVPIAGSISVGWE
jgi:hypothetical protein